ncbi:methyl-CpG-binding domain-containing protein 9 isoform X2 [Ricinus communis]|uniref:methyl-CpG-binding domain-containing protein 9 isoform X2 n=1 Tax=Ricinus communis TaxID=3988 RepID=UPI00201B00DB|nr:methyl-CpG-binding domain-containing protein 9 isoform X2 [Ricinus communis]
MEEVHDGKSSCENRPMLPFDIDLNETPLSSPRETALSPPPSDVVAGEGSGGRRKVSFLDINALPTEAEGQEEEQQQECSDFVNSSIVKSGPVDVVQQRLNFVRTVKEVDPRRSVFIGRQWAASDYSANTTVSIQSQSEKYLQNLREFIFDNHGVLEDGWHVEFFNCQKRCKTLAVYCSPDGNKFESMFDVACHLGLVSNSHSLVPLDRNDGFALAQNGLHLHRRRKESLLFSRAKDLKECQEYLKSSFAGNFSLGLGTADAEACKLSHNTTVEQAKSEPIDINGSSHCKDGFPVQFEDFYVLSAGEIDPRPSYHCTSQIWPVGYKSSWHDKITGSLFVCDISDGGDCGPIFKVQRYPCSTTPFPIGSTILFRPGFGTDNKKSDSTSHTDNNEDIDVQMILSDHSPPHLDFKLSTDVGTSFDEISNSQPTDGLGKNLNSISRNLGKFSSANRRIGDDIGEFLVEGRSSSSVWRMVSEKLVHSCREVYKQIGICKFCCRHAFECWSSCLIHETLEANISPDSLAKFCHLSGPFNVLHHVESNDDLANSCEALVEWLGQDRFGLDIDFVQEIIEQLPGVQSCSDYTFLDKRSNQSKLQTVQNGYLLVKRKEEAHGEKETYNMLKGCRNPKKQHLNDSCPPGKPLSSKLPTVLVGDVLQSWELLWRFSEVLGLDRPLSFKELEEELTDCNSFTLMNSPVSKSSGNSQHVLTADDNETPEECAEVRQAPDTLCCCAGETLYKAHCSLLKILLEELESKLAVFVDPSLESGESRSRKRRKKEADSLIYARKLMLDLLPINELTWPELARRYLLTVSSMEGNLDSAEVMNRESCKVFHCLQGDSGALYGSLPGVALMEADALLLAEAIKQIFGTSKNVNSNLNVDSSDSVAPSSSKEVKLKDGEVPEWAKVLEPVRKLPTNVGARIRRCIYNALELNPPEWATKILKHSISREVYKGNASGPTKKAVLSVLADVCGETPQQKPNRKRKGKHIDTLPDVIMKQCRKVLRRAAAADEEKIFCNLLGRTLLNTSDNDDEGLLGFPTMVSRPLDFRTIDLRLAFGAYGGSHEAFLEDVREVWHHIRTAYADQSDLVHLAEKLSQNFEALYKNEVLTLVQKLTDYAAVECSNSEAKKEMEDILEHASQMPKAPWDEGVCKVCGVDKDDDNVLLCDKCDSGYHTYCLNPPLARIPEGNWYCPSCITQGASQVPQFVSHCRKKRRQGEFTHGVLEALAHLGTTMEITDYWDYSVEERIFLLKFLGDEVLNSANIREHLDQCASVSADLQQKLRSLSMEWRNLKFKEELMLNGVGKSGKEGTTTVLPNYNKLLGQTHSRSSLCSTSFIDLEHLKDGPRFPRTNDFTKRPCWVYPKGVQVQQPISNGSQVFTISDTECQVNQPDVNQLQTSNLESIFIRDKASVLQDSVTSLELQLQKASLRKEFLGRDSAGRVYWAFSRTGSLPWVVIDGTTVVQQSSIAEENRVLRFNNLTFRSSIGAQDLLRFKGSNVFSPYASDLTSGISVYFQWFSHQSYAEIEELIKWLRDNDPMQRELIESLLQRLNFGYSNSNKAANYVLEMNQPASMPVNIEKTLKPKSLETRALTALEKKYGPCMELDVTNISVKFSRNLKVTYDDRMCRCECLEAIWPSRHHCLSCHRSFSSRCELEEHNDGKCGAGAHTPQNSRVTDDVSKEKVLMRAEHGEWQCKAGGAGHEIEFGLIGFRKEFMSPYNLEEISAKFVTRSSNKELVKEIGLLGSNGIPSLVPCSSPYLIDPTLKLVLPCVNEVCQSVQSTNVENGSLQGDTTTSKRHANKSNATKDCTAVDLYEELQEIGRSYLMNQSSLRFSCTKLGNPLSEIRGSALRPLVGKGAHILRQLKINLLDMDAALPEEAVKSSNIYLEKRCAWRAFVKSAKSVFEMVQATIVLENMIKTDFLRNEWWYWSSLSAAAKIATISSLALRIYTLDAAIVYEKTLPFTPPKDIAEVGSKSDNNNSPPHTDLESNPKPSSKPVLRSHNLDLTDNKKPQSRSGKKRKDSGG